jgi:hypothetical protein
MTRHAFAAPFRCNAVRPPKAEAIPRAGGSGRLRAFSEGGRAKSRGPALAD